MNSFPTHLISSSYTGFSNTFSGAKYQISSNRSYKQMNDSSIRL